jgi:hypothetical protein
MVLTFLMQTASADAVKHENLPPIDAIPLHRA